MSTYDIFISHFILFYRFGAFGYKKNTAFNWNLGFWTSFWSEEKIYTWAGHRVLIFWRRKFNLAFKPRFDTKNNFTRKTADSSSHLLTHLNICVLLNRTQWMIELKIARRVKNNILLSEKKKERKKQSCRDSILAFTTERDKNRLRDDIITLETRVFQKNNAYIILLWVTVFFQYYLWYVYHVYKSLNVPVC